MASWYSWGNPVNGKMCNTAPVKVVLMDVMVHCSHLVQVASSLAFPPSVPHTTTLFNAIKEIFHRLLFQTWWSVHLHVHKINVIITKSLLQIELKVHKNTRKARFKIDGQLNLIKVAARPLSSLRFDTSTTAVTKTSFHSAPLNRAWCRSDSSTQLPLISYFVSRKNSQANSPRAMEITCVVDVCNGPFTYKIYTLGSLNYLCPLFALYSKKCGSL